MHTCKMLAWSLSLSLSCWLVAQLAVSATDLGIQIRVKEIVIFLQLAKLVLHQQTLRRRSFSGVTIAQVSQDSIGPRRRLQLTP